MKQLKQHESLPAVMAERTALARLTERVLASWPAHRPYVEERFDSNDEAHLDFCERISHKVWSIIAHDPDRYAKNYRWTCERMLEEEYYFHRSGAYRYKAFAEVQNGIDLDGDFMTRYLDGLLLSEIFWVNQTCALHTYVRDFLVEVRPGDSILEVGPGHGLFLALAAERPQVRVVGWDVSERSIANTSHALDQMGVGHARLAHQNLHEATADEQFDFVVASELLEHVDAPDVALRRLRDLVRPGGKLFANIPVNSPAPDHINLWRTPEEVSTYVRSGELRILSSSVFPMTGYTEEEARRNQSTLSCVLVCEPE